jgi:hypothetical protein
MHAQTSKACDEATPLATWVARGYPAVAGASSDSSRSPQQPARARPDLHEEAASWQTGDKWQYALLAAVAYIHASAQPGGRARTRACRDLAQRPGQPLP